MIVRYLVTSVLLFLIQVAGAQQPVQERISSAGGNYAARGISLNWSLGSTVVPTLRSGEGKLVLTHGFQEKITVTAIDENIGIRSGIVVYPNPATETLKIRFPEAPGGRIGMIITDSEGRVVITGQVEGFEDVVEIDLGELNPGMYFLRLSKEKSTNVYKVIKL